MIVSIDASGNVVSDTGATGTMATPDNSGPPNPGGGLDVSLGLTPGQIPGPGSVIIPSTLQQWEAAPSFPWLAGIGIGLVLGYLAGGGGR